MRFLYISVLALSFCNAVAQKPAQLLVGKWKYDTSTMKMELNAKGKLLLKDPKKGPQIRQFLANYQKNLGAVLKTMKLTFKADRTMTVDAGKPEEAKTGTWSINGRSVKVIMTDAKQKTPAMEISADGKRIHTKYVDPNFGVGKVDLVRG